METRKWIGLREAADYICIGYSTAKQLWPTWEKFGVRAHKVGKRLIFKTAELDRMVEMCRIN